MSSGLPPSCFESFWAEVNNFAVCQARVVWAWHTWVPLCGHIAFSGAAALVPFNTIVRNTWQRGKAALLWREPESTVTSNRGLSHSYWDYSYSVGVLEDRVRQWTRMDIPSILPVLPPSLLQKKSWCRCLYPVSFFPHCICLSSLAAVEGNLARDADTLPCLWDGRFLKNSNLAKRRARKTEGRRLIKTWRGLSPGGFEEGYQLLSRSRAAHIRKAVWVPARQSLPTVHTVPLLWPPTCFRTGPGILCFITNRSIKKKKKKVGEALRNVCFKKPSNWCCKDCNSAREWLLKDTALLEYS